MNRRRQKRPNWFLISLLVLLIAGFTYMDRFIIPTYQSPFVPTATATPPPEQFITQAQGFVGQGKLSQAIDAYNQALALKPNDPSIYIELAQVQVLAGDYKDAQTNAEDALLLNPNLSEANAVRASALDWQGNYLDAEAAVKRALELDPNNADAHAYYAEILTDEYLTGSGTSTDVLDTAITELKTALSLAPNSLEAHRARGYILEATGNYEEFHPRISGGRRDQCQHRRCAYSTGKQLSRPGFLRSSCGRIYQSKRIEPGRPHGRPADLAHLCRNWCIRPGCAICRGRGEGGPIGPQFDRQFGSYVLSQRGLARCSEGIIFSNQWRHNG